jgi:hypothetical protein
VITLRDWRTLTARNVAQEVIVAYAPSIRQREVAKTLVRWRLSAPGAPSQAQVAKWLKWSAAKQNRLERAEQSVSPADLMALALALEVDEAERVAWFHKAMESMDPGWWDQISKGALRSDVLDYVQLEDDARRLQIFRNDVVPGPFQIPEYGVALASSTVSDADQETVRETIRARQIRQKRLYDDDDFHVQVVLTESAARGFVGSLDIMRAQRSRLLELAQLPSVDLRILATEKTVPPVGTGFIILSFGEDQPDVSYIELPNTGVFVEGEDANVYGRTFRHMWGEEEDSGHALSTEESLELLASIDQG